MKPTILCVGSCITENVGRALKTQASLDEKFDILFSSGNLNRLEHEFSDDELHRCVLTIQDIGPWQGKNLLTEREQATIPEGTPLIAIPGLHMSSMWPFLTNDPRNKPCEGFPWGPYPTGWTDRIALEVIGSEGDPAARLARFLEIDPLEHVDLSRFHEMEIVNMIIREEGFDVRVAAYAASRFRKQRLFYVYHHPSGELFESILSQIVFSEKFRSVHRKGLASLVDGLGQWCVDSGVFQDEQMPIHPRIAEQLGLEWWHRDMVYRLAGRDWTFESWMSYYLSENLPEAAQ